MVPRERISERICEQIVDATVSHSQPQILKEVVVKAAKNVPQERFSEKIGEQIEDDVVPVDQRGDQACRGHATTANFVEDGGSPAGAVRRDSCGRAFDQADQPGNQAGRDSAVSTHRRGAAVPADQQGDQAGRVSADCGDTVTGPSRSSADGPRPSSVEEQLFRMAMLMPGTEATWESISQLSDSAEKDALMKQLCGCIQHRLVLA